MSTSLGTEMVRCADCILIPSDCYQGHSPRIDAAFKANRESWYVVTGSITYGNITLPLSSEYFPCDVHLAILKANV